MSHHVILWRTYTPMFIIPVDRSEGAAGAKLTGLTQ
jgi:uncharacterized protein Veg